MSDEPQDQPVAGVEPSTNPPPDEPRADREALAQAYRERDQAVAAAQLAAQEAQARAEAVHQELAAANDRALQAHRRALLAEHVGLIVPELVAGATAEEMDASVETARAAFQRIAEQVRGGVPVVPAGASPRQGPVAEELSPLDKITRGLRRGG